MHHHRHHDETFEDENEEDDISCASTEYTNTNTSHSPQSQILDHHILYLKEFDNDKSIETSLVRSHNYVHNYTDAQPTGTQTYQTPRLYNPERQNSAGSMSIIQTILEEYPTAAFHLDHCGRLPLHLAMDVATATLSHAGRRNRARIPWEDIQHLLRIHPSSIGIKDPVTGLLPFMLAATAVTTESRSASSTTTASCPYEKEDGLDVVFGLLLSSPDLICNEDESENENESSQLCQKRRRIGR